MPDPTSDIQSSWLANYFATHPMGGADSAFNIGGGVPGSGFAGLADAVVPAPVTAPAPTPIRPMQPMQAMRPAAPQGGLPLPSVPDVPKASPLKEPPKAEYRDPMMALGNPLTLLALVASSFVRNPAVAAGNAMASAIDAQHKGDLERYQVAYKEYEQYLKKALSEQRQEQLEYHNIYANKKLSLDERLAELKMAALKRKDHTLVDAIGSNQIDQILGVKAKVAGQLQEGVDKADAHNAAKLGPGGLPFEGLRPDVLAALPPSVAAEVKALAEYRLPVMNFRSQKMQELVRLATAYNPNFDALNYAGHASTLRDFTSGPSAKNIVSFNTLIGHLRSLHDAASELNNTKFATLNAPLNWLVKQTGDPRIARFQTIAKAVADEAGRAFKGTATEGEVKRWASTFDTASSPAQLQASITALTDLLESRIQALGEQYSRGMGTPASGMQLLDPKARASLEYINTIPVGKRVKAPAESGAQTLDAIWGTQ